MSEAPNFGTWEETKECIRVNYKSSDRYTKRNLDDKITSNRQNFKKWLSSKLTQKRSIPLYD